jgi:hypothetical protein
LTWSLTALCLCGNLVGRLLNLLLGDALPLLQLGHVALLKV